MLILAVIEKVRNSAYNVFKFSFTMLFSLKLMNNFYQNRDVSMPHIS